MPNKKCKLNTLGIDLDAGDIFRNVMKQQKNSSKQRSVTVNILKMKDIKYDINKHKSNKISNKKCKLTVPVIDLEIGGTFWNAGVTEKLKQTTIADSKHTEDERYEIRININQEKSMTKNGY